MSIEIMDFRVQDQLTVHAVRYYDKYENVFDKPNEQNDACIKSAMARKGGCEETKIDGRWWITEREQHFEWSALPPMV